MKQQSTLLRLVIILLFIFSTILTTAAAPYAAAKAIYVDGTNGLSTNDGLSLTKAKKTIQQAVDLAQPGDTIYVRAGTYYENVIVTKSGLAGAPITLTRYNTDTVILNGGSEIALRAKGQINYWTIENLTLRSTNRYTIRLGWWGEPTTSYWTVRNNKIFGANFLMGSYHLWENNNIDGTGYTVALGDAGISDAGDSHHNIYRGNTVHDFTHHDARGIWTQGFTYETIIENNYVYNIMAKTGLGQCIDLDGAAKVEWRHIVRGNTVSNCSYVGIQLENAFDSIVEKNTILESGSAGIIVISYNATVGCPTGGESGQYGDTNGDNSCRGDDTDNIIRQNVIANAGSFKPGYGGIIIWYAGGVDIWGNTISSASGSGNGGINIQGTAAETQGTTLINNILKTGSGVSVCAQDLKAITVANNNLVHRDNNLAQFASGTGCGTQYTLAQFKTATGLGSNTVVADPRFSNVSAKNFSLLLDSPAIDTGVPVGSTSDINGLPRPSGAACDIGAHEFQGQAAVIPTKTPTSAVTVNPTAAPTQAPTQNSNAANVALNKTASQSNTLNGAAASRAIDGNTDGNLSNGSVSSTLVNTQGWWEVDLGAAYDISKIALWNRTDTGDWRLANFYILISNTPFASKDLTATLNQAGVTSYFSAARAEKPSEFAFNTTGRYVRIQLLNRDYLSIAEVQVFGTKAASSVPTLVPTTVPTLVPTKVPTLAPTTVPTQNPIVVPTLVPTQNSNVANVALNKTTSQSNTLNGAAASRAVDGNTDGNLSNGSVSSTLVNTQGWWEVDLGAAYDISKIALWNRTDTGDWRLANFYILISNTPFASKDLTATLNQAGVTSYFSAARAEKPSEFAFNTTGRYVRIQLLNRDYLSIAEVQVFGKLASSVPTLAPTKAPTLAPTLAPTKAPTLAPTLAPTKAPTLAPTQVKTVENVAKNKSAEQSSTFEGAVASRAVDGNTDGNFANGSVSSTSPNTQGWWEVDLGASYDISKIAIYNRTDTGDWRLANFYILISNTPFVSKDLTETLNQPGVTVHFSAERAGKPSEYDFNTTGRYVRIQLLNREYLALTEVEIYGIGK